MSFPFAVSSTNCPVDPLLPETAPGNSYECPDLLPDGTPNDYNTCCHNDRPDSEGNFHSCCQSEEEKNEAKMGKFYLICGYIGIGTAAVMTSVFAYTYCRDDTFPCLKPIRRTVKKHFDRALDAVCFCSFLPKKIRRRGKKNDIPEEPKKPRVSPKYNNDPTKMDVPDDQFWA
ncbi:hypothetical protein HOLleu_02075 [Holothuria leucospilota]|uniref:Uncharacterized protein n=1 Tax=Holothuria leucospilota TaxID=206669 RepID=A0A9Q1CQ70_HOLLE|nr:hypothetical protein HOLleu_02075 [Holothuria leucospilota]